MIVDEILLNPAVPDRIRPMLHAALVQSLVEMGAFHRMDGTISAISRLRPPSTAFDRMRGTARRPRERDRPLCCLQAY